MKLIKKLMSKEVIMYIIFGGLTTILNWVLTYLFDRWFDGCNWFNENIRGSIASAIAIVLSILFAFFTNRKWVFESKVETSKDKLYEFGKFVAGRAVTMIVEQGGVMLFNGVFGFELMIVKVIASLFVAFLNYFISKLLVFKDTNKNSEKED